MSVIVGLGLALLTAISARVVGFDRDRAFYPVVLVVIASYYVLFAAMGGTTADFARETIWFSLFAAAAAIGFRTTLWIVVAALALHGAFDLYHHSLVKNPGVPTWWPAFCVAFDVVAAACLAALILKDEISARATHSG